MTERKPGTDISGLLLGTRLAKTVAGEITLNLVGLALLVIIVVLFVERPALVYGLPAAYVVYAAVRVAIVARRSQRGRGRD